MTKPATEPPSEHAPNFENPDLEIYYICVVSNAIAIPIRSIFVFLRLHARYRMSTKLQGDDSTFRLGHNHVSANMLTYVDSCLYNRICKS
jgi:hypothetical protein